MENSFGCFFYLKKKGKTLSVELPIYLKITVNSESVQLSTKRKCFKQQWNVKAGRAEGKTDYAKSINTYLDTLQQKVFEAKRRLIEVDEEVTPAKIKHLMLGGKFNKEKCMLMEQFKIHNEQMQALIGKDYAKGTLDRYEIAYRHTLQFLESKYKVSDIDIEKLDYDFIMNYEFWLKTVRKCDHNTTMKYLANFKKIVIRCVKSGKLVRDPFVGFVMSKKEVEREVLNDTHLRRIAQENFSAERMALVRDIFLFCCFTGLAYADIKKLKQTEILKGNDGGLWIIAKRQKTNVTSRVPLLPPALEIIERYKSHPQCEKKEWCCPF